jgi:hypothetical protein
METADGGRQTAGEQAFQPVERQTVNEWGNEETNGDRGQRTADRGKQALACWGGRPSTNRGTKKRMETADRGWQTA